MTQRQMVSLEEIKDRLLDRVDAVVAQYAPAATGSYRKGHLWFTLNPGRPDRSVGSFCVHLSGAKAGRWCDYATDPKGGDLIDLIGLSLNLDAKGAIAEARAFLGLETETPELRRRREEAAARAKAAREAERAEAGEKLKKRRATAKAVWLSGQAQLSGTPVDHYLRGRDIDLARLAHPPGAIRFHPACRYYFEEELVDQETGEIRTRQVFKVLPAMLCAITRGQEIIDCHRTYLERGPQGWRKADLPDAKKVFADYTGGAVRLSGTNGPRGGLVRLNDAAPGSRVYITEGIENGLSLMTIRALTGRPPAFVIAAGMVWNLGRVDLPAAIGEVVLMADNDQGAQARQALDAAIAAHAKAGRIVRVWSSEMPGEDLNDALQRALQAERALDAAQAEGAVA